MKKRESHRIGVLTALAEVELPAALRAFDIPPEAQPAERHEGERYWLSTIHTKSGYNLEMVVSCFGLSGNTESPLPVDRLIRNYRPELVILCGIACGVRDYSLGDVVTADTVWAYEYVKTTGKRPLDRSRARSVQPHIRDDIQFFSATGDWQEKFMSLQRALDPALSPRLQPRPLLRRSIWIASGEKVMANGELAALKKKYDLIRAGEMEGYGFANACVDRRPPVSWLVIRGISDYGDKSKDDLKDSATLKDEYHCTAANAATSFARSFLVESYTVASSRGTQRSPPCDFGQSLLAELATLVKQERYDTILRYRETFSRFLWVEGRLKERIALGRIAEDAAARLGKRESQVAALLDDIGWSLLSLRQFKRARQSILHGLQLADNLKNTYWSAKGHRHLAGLHLEEKHYKQAYAELDSAAQLARRVSERKQRIEMLAGIAYGRALTALEQGDLKKSLAYLKRSEELREELGDPSRTVRIYAIKAKIAEARGDISSAKDLYRAGLEDARRIGRKDEMIRNHLGLARVYGLERDFGKAQKHRNEAHEMLAVTPVPYEPGESDADIRRLGRKR